MPRYVAFLRAINVGGHTVRMEDLRANFEHLGLSRVETYIASGNVIFETRATGVPALERKIEDRLKAALGHEVATFLRTVEEVADIARHEAFPEAAIKTAGANCVGFLTQPLSREQAKLLTTFANSIDSFHLNGREIYWLSRVGQSESKFSNAVLEKALKIRATFRGIKTIRGLTAKFPPGRGAGRP